MNIRSHDLLRPFRRGRDALQNHRLEGGSPIEHALICAKPAFDTRGLSQSSEWPDSRVDTQKGDSPNKARNNCPE